MQNARISPKWSQFQSAVRWFHIKQSLGCAYTKISCISLRVQGQVQTQDTGVEGVEVHDWTVTFYVCTASFQK